MYRPEAMDAKGIASLYTMPQRQKSSDQTRIDSDCHQQWGNVHRLCHHGDLAGFETFTIGALAHGRIGLVGTHLDRT